MPGESVHLALERPIIGTLHQSMAHRVASHVQPFHIVAIAVPQLMVPKVPLPDQFIFMVRPSSGHMSFPFSYPLPERTALKFVLSSEKMNVVWQDDVTSDSPLWRVHPCRSDQIMDFLASEYVSALMRAGGYEENDAKVADGDGQLSGRVFT